MSLLKADRSDAVFEALRTLCCEGRLFDVQAWCAAGKPIDFTHANVSYTPMGIAITKGFHSLAQVLIENGTTPNGKLFWLAIRRRRNAIAALIAERWALPVVLDGEIATIEPATLKQLIAHGADLVTGSPISEGLKRHPHSTAKLFKELVGQHPELQIQADIGLRYLCEFGSLRSVCLALQAGANPRRRVPLKPREHEDHWKTGLQAAVAAGRLEVVEQIGLSADDNLNALLEEGVYSESLEMVQHLVKHGADVNVITEPTLPEMSPNTPLEIAFSTCETDQVQMVKTLVSLGAKVRSGEEPKENLIEFLWRLRWDHAFEMITYLHTSKAASDEILATVIAQPHMQHHLRLRRKALNRLFESDAPM